MYVYDKYLINLFHLNPSLNDSDYKNYKNTPNIYSKKYKDKINELDENYIKYLKKLNKKNRYEKILQYDLINSKSFIDYDLFPLNIYNNIYVEYILNTKGNHNYKFNNKDDYLNYIKYLKLLNNITDYIIKLLKRGIKENIKYSKIIVTEFINYFNYIINEKKYKHLKNIPSSIRSRFNKSVNLYLIKNIKRVVNFLENEYINYTDNKIGLCCLKNGKKEYLHLLKLYTYKELTPEKIIDIAKKELNKSLKKLNKIKNKLKFKGNLNDLQKFIFNNDNFKYKTNKELIDDLNKIIKKTNKIVDKNFYKVNIDFDYDIKINNNIEYGLSVYYKTNKEKKGIFFIKDKDILNKNEIYVLSLHEGNPGHNYEYLINKKRLPMYFKFNYYDGFSEGWATYVESLMESKNLYELFYQEIYNLFRIIRLFIDVGIHYYTWDFNKAYTFYNKYLEFDSSFIKEEIIRCISTPGQLLSYKIGQLLISEYKDKFLKKNSNIKDFHKLILDIGPCPLDILMDELKKN